MARRAEILIVGGGLAGAGAAVALASARREVVLIERERGAHDKVCGEFLSLEAQRYLAALGVDPQALGAVPVERVRLVAAEWMAETLLPFQAASLSRRILDEALLARAEACGAEVRRGRRVLGLEAKDGGGWAARLEDGGSIATKAAFLATGKHDLRGWRRPKGVQGDLVAFKQHFRLVPQQAAALRRSVELILFADGYAGLEPVEDGRANLCLLVRRRRLTAIGQSWGALLAALLAESPHLARRLAGAEAVEPWPLAVAALPYGHLRWRAAGLRAPGLRGRGLGAGEAPWRLGDQAAVIPSFTGDGMSIALHSARLAASCYLAGRSAGAYQRRLARDLVLPLGFATALSLMLVRPRPQAALAALAGRLPRTLAVTARGTRLPARALARAGV